MALHFCPHCGVRLQPDFNFCPSCGTKLPIDGDWGSSASPSCMDNDAKVDEKPEPCSPVKKTRQTARKASSPPDTEKPESCSSVKISRQTARKVKSNSPSSPGQKVLASPRTRKPIGQEESCSDSPLNSSPQASPAGQKALASPRKRKLIRQDEESCSDFPLNSSPLTSPGGRKRKLIEELRSDSPLNSSPQTSPAGKGKYAKTMSMVPPLQEGEELTDQSGTKWKLLKLLSQSDNEVTYKVQTGKCHSQNYILRMAAKDGQIFTEQNFLQRAGRKATVEKWLKRVKLDYIGMPSCLGFGLHETYRFLVFEDMGQSLNTVIQGETKPLSPKVVLKLACRILDVLEFVHENEYTHADIRAENVYISSDSDPKVTLSGFGRAFRFCPGGKHVEYRKGSRAPHLGHHDFISLDVHFGAAPSRRSDLQSLGYCLIYWMRGVLPWNSTTQKPHDIAAEKERCIKDPSRLLHHSFGREKVSGALQEYLSQVMNLEYSETPNYTQLKAGLTQGLEQLGVALEDPLELHI